MRGGGQCPSRWHITSLLDPNNQQHQHEQIYIEHHYVPDAVVGAWRWMHQRKQKASKRKPKSEKFLFCSGGKCKVDNRENK